jgi:hypothetical protein
MSPGARAAASALLLAAFNGHAADLDAVYRDTLKAGAVLADAPALPQSALGLLPLDIAAGAPADPTPACGAKLAAAPLVIGSREQFEQAGGLVRSVGLGLLSRALSTATGGAVQSGGDKAQTAPPLREDPIKKRLRSELKDSASGTRLDLGAQLAGDGLLLSTRLDSAPDKGTVHEIYLERADCRRMYPYVDYAYELWESWKLSVSWTRTTSTYRDGQLVDRQTTAGGFTREGGGLLAAGSGRWPLSPTLDKSAPEVRDAIDRYQARIREETGVPLWQRLGFGAPTSGPRAVGTAFRLSAGDLAALRAGALMAVVEVTREQHRTYEAVGIPVNLGVKADGTLSFALAH